MATHSTDLHTPEQREAIVERLSRQRSFDGGDGGGYHDQMEERVKELEKSAQDTRDRLIKIETRLDSFATKEDLHKELNSMTWRLVTFTCSFGTALVGVTYFLATHVK